MKWVTLTLAIALLAAAPGGAQAQEQDTRPATTTNLGDTGLWFIPTAEGLPNRQFSISVQRTESNFRQGNTNVSFWPVTGAYGLGRVLDGVAADETSAAGDEDRSG